MISRKLETITRKRCPVCDSDNIVPRFVMYDDRYGLEDYYHSAECINCKSHFLIDAIIPELYSELYLKYYPDLNFNGKAIQSDASSFLQKIKARGLFFYRVANGFFQGKMDLGIYVNNNESVLDVGCGEGGNSFLVKQMGADWTGLEIDSKRCEAIRRTGLKCINGSIENIRLDFKGKFDVILASQVIEHTFDPQQFIEACSYILRPGGRLILSTPNIDSRYRKMSGENWIHWHVPYHQTIFSINGLDILCEKHGLKLHSYEFITPTSWALNQHRYKKPLCGTRGEWYGKAFSKVSIIANSFIVRIKDALCGNGDAIIAAFKKVDA